MGRSTIKFFSWTLLIGFWFILVIYFAAFRNQYAFAWISAGLGFLSLFGLSALLSWQFGIGRHASKHLGKPMSESTYVSKTIPGIRVPDYRRLLEKMFESETNATRLGGSFNEYGMDLSTLTNGEVQRTALQWTTRHTSDGEIEQFVTNAVYLLRIDDCPVVVSILSKQEHFSEFTDMDTISTNENTILHMYGRSIEDAKRALQTIIKQSSRHSVYRGQLIQVSPDSVRIAERPEVDDQRIILPPEILETVARAVSARSKHHQLLTKLGHSSKTGIMLHGPPGTGKTLVAKHLVGSCEGHTGIIPNDLETATIRQCFQMAAYLHPAIILIEDVDLLARRREENWNISGLQQLMNEMDGLAPTCETIVLMSTNRPEVVEPALINRPGRVSQAIYFPLPDAQLRTQLFNLYCPGLTRSDINLKKLVEKTKGSSPAFIEELCKRAILFAAERQGIDSDEPPASGVELQSVDLDNALHELLVVGGNLTKGILGFDQSNPSSP